MTREKTYSILVSTLIITYGLICGCNKDDLEELRPIIINVKSSDELEGIAYRFRAGLGADAVLNPNNPDFPYFSFEQTDSFSYKVELEVIERTGILIRAVFKENNSISKSNVIYTITDAKTNELLSEGKSFLQGPHDIFEVYFKVEL